MLEVRAAIYLSSVSKFSKKAPIETLVCLSFKIGQNVSKECKWGDSLWHSYSGLHIYLINKKPNNLTNGTWS